jgi:ABC-type nickel/cobalt efflux system permease component RcnA
MPASGEGGRLAYTPVAWLALAIGVAGSEPASDIGPGEDHPWYRRAGLALIACATFAGTWVLQGELRAARSAQNQVRDLVNASREWAVTHAGLTLLMIEQNYGPIVTTRNAQAWLVLPPIQPTPLLQRVLPTLPAELSPRHDQLLAGLATRLDKVRPSRLDGDELGRLFEHDAAHWPEHYACWSRHKHRFVELAAPDPSDRTRWVAALLDGFGQCTSAG